MTEVKIAHNKMFVFFFFIKFFVLLQTPDDDCSMSIETLLIINNTFRKAIAILFSRIA